MPCGTVRLYVSAADAGEAHAIRQLKRPKFAGLAEQERVRRAAGGAEDVGPDW